MDRSPPLTDKLETFLRESRDLEAAYQKERTRNRELAEQLQVYRQRMEATLKKQQEEKLQLQKEKEELRLQIVSLRKDQEVMSVRHHGESERLQGELQNYRKAWEALKGREEAAAEVRLQNEALTRKTAEANALNQELQQYLAKTKEQIRKMESELSRFSQEVRLEQSKTKSTLDEHARRIGSVEEKLGQIQKTLEALEGELSTTVDSAKTQFEKRQGDVVRQLLWIKKWIAETGQKLQTLETATGKFRQEMERRESEEIGKMYRYLNELGQELSQLRDLAPMRSITPDFDPSLEN